MTAPIHPPSLASLTARPIDEVVQQHAEESALLRQIRSVLLRAPHVQLHRLRRLDERLAAHLDGVAVAGPLGLALLEAGLESPTPGVVFALTVCALQGRNAALLQRLVTLAATLPEAERGLLSALGWVSPEDLQGTVRALLGSKVPEHRAWALAACAMHRVDPGASLVQAIEDVDARVRARAWRVAGQVGRRDLADAARQAVARPTQPGALPSWDHPADQQAAAWALVLWGHGQHEGVRQALMQAAPQPEPSAPPLPHLPPLAAHRLAILTAPADWGREQIRLLGAQADAAMPVKRRMMQAVAWLGDVQAVPWLIQHMSDDRWARLAGEALSTITGADLAALGLERKPPKSVQPGPTDRPQDWDVALDEDDSLPWPDAQQVQAWWQLASTRFVAGQRYVGGQTAQRDHLIHLLKTAGQRQRILAAEHLALLNPAAGVFPVAAPAWRQQRWLAQGAV